MQNQLLKFVLFFLLMPSPFAQAYNSHEQELLNKADSLFDASRYTESLEYYHQLYSKGLNSAAMLLKMAYVHEGMENFPDALYYLNIYFLKSSDVLALQKMNELASKHRLSGYDTYDTDRIYGFYSRNFMRISLVLASILILIFSLGFYQKRKVRLNTAGYLTLFIVFALVFTSHANFGSKWKQGVILHENTVIMKGPSAASGVQGTVAIGTRVEVVNKKDTWLVIKTEKGRGYVRESTLRLVEL